MINYRCYSELDDKLMKLEIVSGYTVDDLIYFFAAGYTLSPPGNPQSLEDIAEIAE